LTVAHSADVSKLQIIACSFCGSISATKYYSCRAHFGLVTVTNTLGLFCTTRLYTVLAMDEVYILCWRLLGYKACMQLRPRTWS